MNELVYIKHTIKDNFSSLLSSALEAIYPTITKKQRDMLSLIESIDINANTAVITLSKDIMIKSEGSIINMYKGHAVTVAETIHFNPDFEKKVNVNVLKNIDEELRVVEETANQKIADKLTEHNAIDVPCTGESNK